MLYHTLDPVIFQLGPIKVYWYGVLYLLALAGSWWLARFMARQRPSQWSLEEVNDLILYVVLGLTVGGRLGYVLFYHLAEFLSQPLVVFQVWRGGLAFHGALIGGLVAIVLFARRSHKGVIQVADFLVPVAPLGILAGHLANFINGELWGKLTSLPWGLVFPKADLEARHPVQLYEALSEGVLLFTLLWWLAGRQPRPRLLSGGFLAAYGVLRIVNECFREPDPQLGYLAWHWLTMGQLLSLPVVIAGAWLIYQAYKDKQEETQAA
jgi:phosphatidylglycerol:prolipoprotein diacylglycerol transferase